MNILNLIQKRCSIRNYSAKAVEDEKLITVLNAARLAPSACNLQPWKFVVIRSDEGKSKIRACYDREWFASAPVYILICADHNTSWKRPSDGKDHADIDIAIATEHICLAAAELNLGTCWVCHFDTQQCKKAFKLPQGIEPTVILPLGYPATEDAFETTPRMSRKPLEEIVVYESF